MKNYFPLIVLLCVPVISFGQNWNCLLPNTKQYFVNSNHHLRGMRIDSVRTDGTDTVYFPFHSPRAVNPVDGSGGIDSNGGSWLGKLVVRNVDGTFCFDNIWNDTVFIKTQAQPGDSWVFYHDTGAINYIATVLSSDTTTINGSLDSIKQIEITARNGSLLVASPINNLSITLSKSHGFVSVFDLYTFPYRDSVGYGRVFDYYFRFMKVSSGNTPPFGLVFPIDVKQQFRQVNYHYPLASEIYDYNVGDKIQTDGQTEMYAGIINQQSQSNISRVDSVVSKHYTPNLGYDVKRWSWGSNSGYQYYTNIPLSIGAAQIYVSPVLFYDSIKMPEEWGIQWNLFYDPLDTSNCFTSPCYKAESDFINVGGFFEPFLEYCGPNKITYKVGVGKIDYASYTGNAAYYCNISSGTTAVCKKNNISCNACKLPLDVTIEAKADNVEVYPNPVNDGLHIKWPARYGDMKVSLLSVTGQVFSSQQTPKSEIIIPVSDLPQGIYILRISDGNGNIISRKLTIQH